MTNGSKTQCTADDTLDSNAEHTECAVVMDQELISQSDEWPILGTPCREITSVPAKEPFPTDTCMSVSNKCTGPQLQTLQVHLCKPDPDIL